MTVPAHHVEAKLHAFRRTKDGVVVSFVLHPQEVPQRLAIDDLGTRYMLAFAEIGDDEQPVEPPWNPADSPKPKPHSKPFRDRSRSQQAALACEWPEFQTWFKNTWPTRTDSDMATELRRLLKIESRSELDDEDAQGRAGLFGSQWDTLYAQFQADTGRTAEAR